MLIFLSTFGSFGDISPFLWLGKTLKEAGHRIIFISNPYFKETILQQNLDFYPAGTLEDYQIASTPANLTGRRFRDQGENIQASRRLYHYMFLKPSQETFEIISQLKTSDTLILHHFYAYGARLAAEKFSIPAYNINLSPYWLRSFKKVTSFSSWIEKKTSQWSTQFIDNQLFTQPFGKLRSGYGLPPLKQSSLEWVFSNPTISLFPEWLNDFETNDSLKLHFTGFPEPTGAEQILPDSTRQFLKRYPRPIIFTPGSAWRNTRQFFEQAVLTLKNLDRPGIFLSRHAAGLPEPLPESIHQAEFIPLEILLDQCSAIVHHGGIGTCQQALRSGVPQLICYRMGEQKENARVISNLGVALALPADQLTAPKLSAALITLLSDTQVAKKCSDIQCTLSQENSTQKLLRIINRG
jgi:UDP:flavonoid glycosyltransferase YjiC (YdhE family)